MNIRFYKLIWVLLATIAGLSSCSTPVPKRPVDYVRPEIDTVKPRWIYFSSACLPFGMVNLSPDTWTKGTWNAGYVYDSLYVRCFSHVHAWQMSGIAVMPTTGEFKGHLGMETYKSAFSHDDEIIKAGYHKIVLKDYNITAELTATTRVGLHRYTFPNQEGYILFDTGAYLGPGETVMSSVTQVSDTEIEGYALVAKTRRRSKDTFVYFVARVNQPFENFGAWENGELLPNDTKKVQGKDAGAFMKFTTIDTQTILLKVAISYTSIEGARRNMDAELPHWNFEQVKENALNEWNNWLGRVRVQGGTEAQKIKLYTDLWHLLLGRRIVSDVDGKYCDMTGDTPVIRQIPLDADNKPLYNHHCFDALWGTHWTANIIWTMLYPEVVDALCNTMVDIYKNGGLIPRGPTVGNYSYVMIGDPAVSLFAAAYNKGIRNWDIETAYEGLRKNAFPGGIRDRAGYEFEKHATGGGMKQYAERGYVPEDLPGHGFHKDGAAMTLEYAYQDWCLAQLAKPLGKKDDYEFFIKRSENYKNIWDPSIKYMRPRNQDGSWLKDFEPVGEGYNTKGFCECNSAIYTNYVPHDMKGLITLFGGQESYNNFLNSSFEKAESHNFVAENYRRSLSWVNYENQPGTEMAHLFNYSGAPWLTQKWVRLVKEKAFGDITPYGGYNGDEDQGQMGALGALMAIGLFEVRGGCAVDPIYEITSPIFDKIELDLNPNYYPGKKFTIITKNNSAENMYIQSAYLNGQPLNKCWFKHSVYANGGTLELHLGPEPNKNWGSDPNEMPPSMSDNGYRDGRPEAASRMEARDQGIVLLHGDGPDSCDIYGARDIWVFEDNGTYYMHYDAAGPRGWLCALATSKDLLHWDKKGPVLELGNSKAEDSKSASYGTTFFDGKDWHMFYLGTPNTTKPPARIPAFPYLTMKAKSSSPGGPWIKQYDVIPFRPQPNTYYSVTASPGQIIKNNGEYLQFFSASINNNKIKRTLGIARTKDLDGQWQIDPEPIVPLEEQIENSSLYYEESTKTWFLFTNHIGIEEHEYTDAIWVYWSKDLNKWDTKNKAVVLDNKNCTWSKRVIGLPSVIRVGNKLAIFYDGLQEKGTGHMHRDVGLAWLDLPL